MHTKLDFEKTPTCLQDKPLNGNHNKKEDNPNIAGGEPHGNNEALNLLEWKKIMHKMAGCVVEASLWPCALIAAKRIKSVIQISLIRIRTEYTILYIYITHTYTRLHARSFPNQLHLNYLEYNNTITLRIQFLAHQRQISSRYYCETVISDWSTNTDHTRTLDKHTITLN